MAFVQVAGRVLRMPVDAFRLTILDRDALEGASCECYARVNDEFDRLFPH